MKTEKIFEVCTFCRMAKAKDTEYWTINCQKFLLFYKISTQLPKHYLVSKVSYNRHKFYTLSLQRYGKKWKNRRFIIKNQKNLVWHNYFQILILKQACLIYITSVQSLECLCLKLGGCSQLWASSSWGFAIKIPI